MQRHMVLQARSSVVEIRLFLFIIRSYSLMFDCILAHTYVR